MPWWIHVYCRKRVEVTAPALKAALDAVPDWLTLAEDYEIDEALVEPALEALRINDALEIRFRADPEMRPIQFWIDDDPAEALAELEDPPPGLDGCVQIVSLELGYPMLENMGVVLAYEVARWLAQAGDGLIHDSDDRWQRIVGGAFAPLDLSSTG